MSDSPLTPAPLPTADTLEAEARAAWEDFDMDGTYIEKLSLADCRIIDERVITFAADFARSRETAPVDDDAAGFVG